MGLVHRLSSKSKILQDLAKFLWQRKIWWLIPLLFILTLLMGVLAISSSAGIAPFMYSLL